MSDNKLIHGLTVKEWEKDIDKYVKVNRLRIKVCKYCGAVFWEGKWIEDNINDIIQKVISRNISKLVEVRYPFTLIDYNIKGIEINGRKILLNLLVKVGIDDKHFDVEKELLIETENSICPRCLARKVKSYDTVIQIRGQKGLSRNDLIEVYNIIRSLPTPVKREIIDIKSTKDGIDVLLNDKGLGRFIAKIFERKTGAHVIGSYKLVSRKPDGKIKSKLSISVRLPPRDAKFFVRDSRNNLIFMYGLASNGYLAYNLDKEKHIVVPYRVFWREMKEVKDISWRIMRVIGFTKDKVVLLDENDYSTYEATSILGEEFVKDERVSVLEYKGKVYVIKTATLERGLQNGKKEKEEKS